jgi:hypothetical protein
LGVKKKQSFCQHFTGPRVAVKQAKIKKWRVWEEKERAKNQLRVLLFHFGGLIAEEGFKQGLTVIAKETGLDEITFIQTACDTVYATGDVLGKARQEI